jgi:hypothetical protein
MVQMKVENPPLNEVVVRVLLNHDEPHVPGPSARAEPKMSKSECVHQGRTPSFREVKACPPHHPDLPYQTRPARSAVAMDNTAQSEEEMAEDGR